MLRTAFLTLVLFVSLSSTSSLRKLISRRQIEPEYCHAIEGFECKCTHYRVTCTSDQDVTSSIHVLQSEKQKYQSVELVLNGERDHTVHEHTFEPVKELYKPEIHNVEFRIKFERFTALRLSSPSIFNRVFPDNLPLNARKHMALEIYNPLIQPDDNVNLFANLNVDSLELYALYPFRGTFQQLFHGANIKHLRLSGGNIHSDLSQPFTGTIGQLEVAKQASELTVQNFPLYPAHELIINAFYINKFNSDYPPNYSNLGELRVHSQESIPANAFRQYPNIRILSISSEKDIDPHALDGLHNLEKLIIKDTKPSLELLNNLPNVKEFEVNFDKLDDREQCQLIEKLANGQVAVKAIPNGRSCTCVLAYLNTASGRYPCDAQNCEQSSCAVIQNNYDASTRTFRAPPPIRRPDGTDALRPREPRIYTSPFQASREDMEKFQQGMPQHAQHPSGQEIHGQQQPAVPGADQSGWPDETRTHSYTTTTSVNQQQNGDQQGYWQPEQPYDPSQQYPYDPLQPKPHDPSQQQQQPTHLDHSDSHASDGEKTDDMSGENGQEQHVGEDENRHTGVGTENQQEGDGTHSQPDPNQSDEAGSTDTSIVTDAPMATNKGFNWLPIIIIIAALAALILIGIIVLVVRKRSHGEYTQAATSEQGAGTAKA